MSLLLLVAETTTQMKLQKMKNVDIEIFIVWLVKIGEKTVFYIATIQQAFV